MVDETVEEKKISWKKCLLLAWSEGTLSLAKYITEMTETEYDDAVVLLQEKGVQGALVFIAAKTENKIDDIAVPVLNQVVVSLLAE